VTLTIVNLSLSTGEFSLKYAHKSGLRHWKWWTACATALQ